MEKLNSTIDKAVDGLLRQQYPDGHWEFIFETYAGMSAQYIICLHFIGESMDSTKIEGYRRYILKIQLLTGGWGLEPLREIDVSASVWCYWALKLLGDSATEDHMIRARDAILKEGGAEKANFVLRIMMALYGYISWTAMPYMSVELALIPTWFPVNLYCIGGLVRPMIYPITVLIAVGAKPENPNNIGIDEIFGNKAIASKLPPIYNHQNWFVYNMYHFLDPVGNDKLKTSLKILILTMWLNSSNGTTSEQIKIGNFCTFSVRKIGDIIGSISFIRARAISNALAWIQQRQAGDPGYGGLAPQIYISLMMYHSLGYSSKHPVRIIARTALELLLQPDKDGNIYFVGSVGPSWDTAHVAEALIEVGSTRAKRSAKSAISWLKSKQILDVEGDWMQSSSSGSPGGWAFQHFNPYYPDTDDTAEIAKVMVIYSKLSGDNNCMSCASSGKKWILGMQSRNGGWGAFDKNNSLSVFNSLPGMEQDIFIDPPTVDVTSRCLLLLNMMGEGITKPVQRAIQFLVNEQEKDGSWYGRWGVNYLYGTFIVLSALGDDSRSIARAVKWLLSVQNDDGGWGESSLSYIKGAYVPEQSSISQTSFALLGLMTAGNVQEEAVQRGVHYVLSNKDRNGLWDEPHFTGTGFPTIILIKYHGYCKYFPLLALAKYRNLYFLRENPVKL